MRRLLKVALALVALVAGAVYLWRRDTRIGTRFMNGVLDPILVRQGISGAGRSEIGTLEHVGRVTGIRRLTPVHPEPTADGFRIVVPLGPRSEWVRNVLAAGHCRIQLHDTVHELDEPVVLRPDEVEDLPAPLARLFGWLGFEYLRLHRFAEHPGALLDEPVAPREPAEPPVEAPTA